MAAPTIGIGILGFGFMGRTHANGYLAAERLGLPVELRGVVGSLDGWEPTGFQGVPQRVVRVPTVEELLARRDIHAVSICTYTDTHVELALAALARGKHVLVEKPVSLRSGEVARLAAAAERAGLLCMPAMCMRFWPGWPWLRERITDRKFGPVRTASFTRIGARPTWGTSFYLDERRSGGALFDLHIHDVDFIRWCFGDPATVSSTGTTQDLTTRYHYPGPGVEVSARGAWLPDPATPFSMAYEVEFAEAVVGFNHASPTVRIARGKVVAEESLPETNAYDAEVQHFLDLIGGRTTRQVAPLSDEIAVTTILEAEFESLALGHAVAPGLPGR